MGVKFSDLNTVTKNEYLNKFIDIEHISENDPSFWNQFLSFQYNLPFSRENSKLLFESVINSCQKLYQNNLTSNNYTSLIRYFCKNVNELKKTTDNGSIILYTTNALLIIRTFIKYLIEIDGETSLMSHTNMKYTQSSLTTTPKSSVNNNEAANASDGGSCSNSEIDEQNQCCSIEEVLYQLLTGLFELCITIPVESNTYNLHLECLNTIIVLLSVQIYEKKPAYESFVYSLFMSRIDYLVSDFVKSLLKHIIQQLPYPPNGSNNRNLLSSMASGLWSVVTLGYGSSSQTAANAEANTNTSTNPDSNINENFNCLNKLLAMQSCHILLILSNHCTNETFRNPYRLALFHFTDTQDTPTILPNSEPLPWFSIDYTKLFNTFCLTMNSDQYTLLLYMLLHRNQHFKMFILSRVNIDSLIVPLLRVIYAATEQNSHHIYMALIILLILSEDDLFNKSIHNIPVKKLNWCTERAISEISLGGLVVLVVIRTIQFNMTRMRDKYLHTNCLAALANMSSKFHNLHSYVCQRINSLFNLLAKKHSKLIALINEQNANENNPDAMVNQDYIQDLVILEELMRMVLEIINSCLTNAIHHNANLVYSILYNKSVLQQFSNHQSFQDIFQNIDLVITHFSSEIDNIEDKSVEKLKEIIELGTKQFSRERFRKFPELKFKYVEEDQPEEFFVPYVWSLVCQSSGLYWTDPFEKPASK